jgi:hypothetical protein
MIWGIPNFSNFIWAGCVLLALPSWKGSVALGAFKCMWKAEPHSGTKL